jgi:diguanylate cyclase (GGDEF)-like protein
LKKLITVFKIDFNLRADVRNNVTDPSEFPFVGPLRTAKKRSAVIQQFLASSSILSADAAFGAAPIPLWLMDMHLAYRLLSASQRAPSSLRAARSVAEGALGAIKTIDANDEARAMIGGDSASMQARYTAAQEAILFNALLQQRDRFNVDAEIVCASGEPLIVRQNIRRLQYHAHPWDRVMIAVEDLTKERRAHVLAIAKENYAQALFEMSPVSLWVEDFSGVKGRLDALRESGVTDFAAHCAAHPEFVQQCMRAIGVIDVNRQTLTLFNAESKAQLYARLDDVFRDDMSHAFKNELLECWQGKLFQTRERKNYTLNGEPLDLHVQWSVLPGYEKNWDRVQVALIDITDRKRAEERTRYLGQHDVLTALKNRAYYHDQILRLDQQGPFPVGVIAIDVNGLKQTNDLFGHAAGDALLRRAGQALLDALGKRGDVARVGGDEFASLLPQHDARELLQLKRDIADAVSAQNAQSDQPALSLSVGEAVCEQAGTLDAALKQADAAMYLEKRRHYGNTASR